MNNNNEISSNSSSSQFNFMQGWVIWKMEISMEAKGETTKSTTKGTARKTPAIEIRAPIPNPTKAPLTDMVVPVPSIPEPTIRELSPIPGFFGGFRFEYLYTIAFGSIIFGRTIDVAPDPHGDACPGSIWYEWYLVHVCGPCFGCDVGRYNLQR